MSRRAERASSGSPSSKFCGERAARWRSPRRSPQLGTQFLRDEVSVDAVTNDLRPDENDQFGPDQAIGAIRERAAERPGKLVEQGNARTAALLALADKAGQ
jgi:hypothetical protein